MSKIVTRRRAAAMALAGPLISPLMSSGAAAQAP